MIHLPQLITDLAIIMVAAAITTILFKKLKQPLVLGYIIAGLLVGPHFSLFPTITDSKNVHVWAEIGVIFLLFSLGLEFSFKKLVKVGGTASITALIEVVVMLLLGYVTGTLLGWSFMDSIFLGGVLSISSTTIIIRAFEELGVKGKKFAGIVFGILVVEDLVAIVLLVLLSTVAVSRQFAGWDMLFSVGKLAFFLVLWFVLGIFFLPTLLRKAKSLMNDEMLLITSIALCLAMVVLATLVGFSPALGAFIMGSILAETTMGEKIEHLTQSVKDLFGAVFFVSVGMLIDPAMLWQYAMPIVIITLVTIVGKMLSTTGGALLSGQPLKPSIQAGMSLSQIGEFSFIIATLGLTLKVTSDFLYPIAVAVSAVTTLTTPYMIKFSVPFYEWVNKVLPEKWKASIDRYSSGAQAIRTDSDWKIVIRSNITQVLIYAIVLLFTILLVQRYALPTEPVAYWVKPLIAIGSIIVISPILWALAFRKIKPEATTRLWADRRYKGPLFMIQVLRIALAVVLVGFLVNSLVSIYASLTLLIVTIAVLILTRKKLQLVYDKIESRFILNLNDKEKHQQIAAGSHLTPWDAHIVSFPISPYYHGIGKTLVELGLREAIGVNIAKIKRGDITINVPGRHEKVYPADVLFFIGTDEQIEALKAYFQNQTTTTEGGQQHEVSLQQLYIKEGSSFHDKTIKDSGIRERTKGLIVGIERDNERLLNPESNMVLLAGDLLWIVGSKKRIQLLSEKQ